MINLKKGNKKNIMPRGRPKKTTDELLIKFTLRLNKDLMSDLNKFCEEKHISKAKAINMAISLYIGHVPKKRK